MAKPRSVTEFPAQTIAVPLSEPEQHAKALDLARITQEIDAARADMAAAAGVARKRIRALTLEQRQLAECVRTGTEQRDAQADFDFAKKKKPA